MENDSVYSVEAGKWIDKDENNKENFSPAQISSFILSKLKIIHQMLKKL